MAFTGLNRALVGIAPGCCGSLASLRAPDHAAPAESGAGSDSGTEEHHGHPWPTF